MKIAISTTENAMNAMMDSKFGRAVGFVIYDTASQSSDYIDNQQNIAATQGAGIQSAQDLLNRDISCVISGHLGPKAFRVFNDAGIKVYNCENLTVEDALSQLQANSLAEQLS